MVKTMKVVGVVFSIKLVLTNNKFKKNIWEIIVRKFFIKSYKSQKNNCQFEPSKVEVKTQPLVFYFIQ